MQPPRTSGNISRSHCVSGLTANNMDAITLENVTKSYDSVTAVNGVNLRVRQGAILGLLGPNGAGKTTTIRMIMNILVPDEGSIKVLDQPVNDRTRDLIGYLPEERGLYPRMKVLDIIVFLAALHGLTEEEAARRAKEWLERLGLAEWSGKKLVDLSKGMQQKVQFITAVIHKPPLVILDEPFSGLDPVNAATVEEIMLEMRSKGSTIVLSTHRMEQVERMCDSICLIDKGRNVLDGELRAVKQSYGKNTLHIEFTGSENFLSNPSIVNITRLGNGVEAKLKPGADPQEILKAAVQANVSITRFELLEPSLNEIFIDRTTRA
ncbi:MAG: ATP-binding cassette domain-containing protein [Candidatus Acidiferrales bacterium]|jgi:ABC-2 type transport system ATP-binding protein